ncbi:MAG: bifunctional folylpolyglutamate synthase/dihydrofolate synthase [Actinomycetota bacterium]
MNHADALAYLDDHSSYEKTGRIEAPSTQNIESILSVMGDPHLDFRVIHVTGTNGKGSTSQIISRLLTAHGLRTGTYSSPHLESPHERMQIDCEPIGEEAFAAAIAGVAVAEGLSGVRPTYFEAMTAAAFRWFSEEAVDVAVVEVGMLGRWDATNVVRPDIAVVTNIALDHTEFAGPTLEHIAREKAGIIKDGCVAIVGETRPALAAIFAAEADARVAQRGRDFEVLENRLALGGRQMHLRTSRADHPEVFVPLHGAHQCDNAAVAIAAVEEFFDAPIHPDVLAEGLAAVAMPGRFELLGHQPLVIVDGAHNPAGADVCAQVFFDDFDPVGRRILVVGALSSRDVSETLGALRADEFDLVVCCTAPSPRARAAREIAAIAESIGCTVAVAETVVEACDTALEGAGADDAILVAGSLYVVGAARPHLRARLP